MTDRYDAYVSPAGKEWMLDCHPQRDVRADVAADLVERIIKARIHGPQYAMQSGKPIWKLRAYDDLWESRVYHSVTSFRQFFRFTVIAGRRAAVFIDGVQKNRENLPKHILDAAERRLDEFVLDLAADSSLQKRCLVQ
jgi:hypothetical protein